MNKTKEKCIAEGNWQCTKYAYERAYEINGYYPCWYNGKGDSGTGKYRNAKLWKDHYRTPYTYIAKADIKQYKVGDVLDFDGKYGHVAIIEDVDVISCKILVSDCNRVKPCTYSEEWWDPSKGRMTGDPVGTGELMGILRVVKEEPKEEPKDTNKSKTTCPVSPYTENEMNLARDVLKGRYGNAPYRKDNIYNRVQSAVNWILKNE